MKQKIQSEKEKKLKHVKVYDRLFEMIQKGVFPPGSQLPSEPDLALQMNVSRMTLRRALALLQEDQLVINIHGKGNFINDKNTKSKSTGMETIQHPVHNCCTQRIEETELEFRIEPPSDFMMNAIKRQSAAVVISDRWYKIEGRAIAYTLSFVPIEVISERFLNLNEKEELLHFLEDGVYQEAKQSHCVVSYTTTGNFTATKYTLSQKHTFLLIQETLYGENFAVLLSNKHYIPLDLFQLQVYGKAQSK